MTERLHFYFSLSCIGEGNGNPLQCSCLENPRDGEAWWAAVYGVAQSRTWLKWLSSSCSLPICFSHLLDCPLIYSNSALRPSLWCSPNLEVLVPQIHTTCSLSIPSPLLEASVSFCRPLYLMVTSIFSTAALSPFSALLYIMELTTITVLYVLFIYSPPSESMGEFSGSAVEIFSFPSPVDSPSQQWVQHLCIQPT